MAWEEHQVGADGQLLGWVSDLQYASMAHLLLILQQVPEYEKNIE